MNIVRGVITLLLMTTFVGLTVWIFAGRQRTRFEQFARIPLDDSEERKS